MISENNQALSCDIRFGISGLRNPSLTAEFYPADIPEDWLLDYYRNEFSVILMSDSELTSHSDMLKQSKAILADAINELYEDIIGEDFFVLLDVSELPEDHIKELLPDQTHNEKVIFLLNWKNMPATESSAFSVPLKWHKCLQESNPYMLYCISAQEAIEPLKLKEMIEQIREHARSEEVEIANVIFSARQNALENCRNAILLESMM